MNNPESKLIIARYYEALNTLINLGVLKSKRAFALDHKIEYTSFSRCERELASNRFQLDWIKYLITDYPINLEWIILGIGGMLKKHDVKVKDASN